MSLLGLNSKFTLLATKTPVVVSAAVPVTVPNTAPERLHAVATPQHIQLLLLIRHHQLPSSHPETIQKIHLPQRLPVLCPSSLSKIFPALAPFLIEKRLTKQNVLPVSKQRYPSNPLSFSFFVLFLLYTPFPYYSHK